MSFTLTSKVGPCCEVMSETMLDTHVTVPTYIIGDRGDILEAREETDLVRTGIFVWYTSDMLEMAEITWRQGGTDHGYLYSARTTECPVG